MNSRRFALPKANDRAGVSGRQPPATAGMMETPVPSGVAV